jgi:hypothetical protein
MKDIEEQYDEYLDGLFELPYSYSLLVKKAFPLDYELGLNNFKKRNRNGTIR